MTRSTNTNGKSTCDSPQTKSLRRELRKLGRRVVPAPIRPMLQFAAEEIVIPDGPFEGLRFDPGQQPYSRLWLQAIDSGRYRRHAALGPTQSGKTLTGCVIPALYHLFEIGETVIFGIPTIDMAQDKWEQDLLPAIMASPRFRELLPSRGEGSRGGTVKSKIVFKNGATLKFMSGGGGDEKRSGFTSRVVVVTEADKLDESGGKSREADKITQMEARTDAYGERARIYLECTVSFESGRIWREYQRGTTSRIVRPCPRCAEWVTPEREQLVGWQEAETDRQARRQARWSCPECAGHWTEEEREAANSLSQLLHSGQTIGTDGAIEGPEPDTDTLAMRWTATDNQFWKAGDVGAREWMARNDPDEENAEKELRQFAWALPYIPAIEDLTALDPLAITKRTNNVERGIVPDGVELLTVGLDLGKWLAHWTVIGWRPGATPHVIDYGRLDVPSADLGVERAILAILREFRDQKCEPGWMTHDGKRMTPNQVWIDSGYQAHTVYKFCNENIGERYRPIKGLGSSQTQERRYARPKSTGAVVLKIGDGWHIARLKSPIVRLVEIDSDYWKTWLAERLRLPMGQPGSMSLFYAKPIEHLSLAKHLTAEKLVEEFVQGKGTITRWDQGYRHNHWLDATYIACAAANFAGAQLVEAKPKPQQPKEIEPNTPVLVMPDGRPFLITER